MTADPDAGVLAILVGKEVLVELARLDSVFWAARKMRTLDAVVKKGGR